MGMSRRIEAYIPDTDVEYQKHKKIFLACREAEVDLPKQTAEYFGYGEDTYPELEMLDEKLEIRLQEGVHYTEYNAEMCEGYEIELDKLPTAVTKLRIYNGKDLGEETGSDPDFTWMKPT
jgi:hypothetical protein